jgi:Glycosyl transferase family 2
MPPSPVDRPASRVRRSLPSVSIVIPVRDSAGLPPMLRSLPAADEMIVVTAEPAEDAAVLATCPEAVLVQQSRTGVGNALACGFAAATGDIVVALDGDGATDPAELPRYVAALVAGADVALGSRYIDGGRDLTAGRFRRGLNRALIWLVNVLYGVHRTDPGFGYTAFWRDAIDRLGLPDPSPAAPPAWGDGPEIEALLTVRTATRGLTVTEVPGVAYPRMRRASRADRTTLRHWLRVLAGEFRGRTGPAPRHAVTTVDPLDRVVGHARPATSPPAAETAYPRPAEICPAGRRRDDSPVDSGVGGTTGERTAGRRDLASRRDAAPIAEPRREVGIEPRREVGMKRRRLEAYRDRPDLRVINGGGTGSSRTRSGRLRSVPRETTGGI